MGGETLVQLVEHTVRDWCKREELSYALLRPEPAGSGLGISVVYPQHSSKAAAKEDGGQRTLCYQGSPLLREGPGNRRSGSPRAP